VKFPSVPSAARLLEVGRVTLWRALTGLFPNPDLARRYADLVLPRLISACQLAELPAGTRLELPPTGDREAIAAALGARVRRNGSALVLLTALPITPPAPASATSRHRACRSLSPRKAKPQHKPKSND
jgi:hypothetical protein